VIAACRLWEKVSAKGNRYLIGRLGGIRALILENTRPEPGDDSTHTLMFAEAPAYDGTRAQAASVEPPPRQRATHGEDGPNERTVLFCSISACRNDHWTEYVIELGRVVN
jgi:hypothetical protein